MEATFIPGQVVTAPISGAKQWVATKAAFRMLGRVLAESVKGDDFSRMFAISSGAQLAALPQGQQSRFLDRGFRP